jgi:hypothetical protein
MACSRNIAGTTGTGRPGIGRITHRGDNIRVLAHAQIIIRAPDNDLMHAVTAMMQRYWMTAGNALQLDEVPISTLGLQSIELRFEMRVIVAVKRHAVARFFLEWFQTGTKQGLYICDNT